MDQLHASDGATPILGVFSGTVFEDPTCARRWAKIERAIPVHARVDEDADAAALARALDAVAVPEEPERVVGWYRTHHEAGLYLSPEEARLHEERFRNPWECALVLAGTADHLAGGVFQRTDPEGLSRSMYAPFYELVEEGAVINATTRRTTVAWTNYQTESRVVGPEEGEAPMTVATIPELAETVHHGPTAGLDVDEEWEKAQTQRSLMAVERSLGPSTIGALGPPAVEDEPVEDSPPAPAAAPVAAVVVDDDGDDDDGDSDDAVPAPGLVGRSRRRHRVPAGKIAVAAAGFGLMAGAGWIGSHRIWGRGTTILSGEEAGLTMSPSDLFGREEVDEEGAVPEVVEEDTRPPSLVAEDTIVAAGDTIVAAGDTIVAEAEGAVVDVDATPDTIHDTAAAEASIVPPPELPDFVVQDPVLAAYENAMTIFRAEVDRYDTDRRSFDDGLSPCNPLNLSYRGVRDAFQRLERRAEEAEARYGESALVSFQSAQRQFTVTKTHYELTDCPMPIGG